MVNELELRSAVSGELQPGEQVLWLGKPAPLRIALQDRERVVTGVLALAALVVILMAFPAVFVFNLLFFDCGVQWLTLFFVLLAGYYFARPIYDYLMAERTIYAVTDRRALIVQPTLSRRVVESYTGTQRVERREFGSGKGDLIFASETRSSRGYRLRTRKIGFFGIDNARQVEQLMLKTFGSRTSLASGG